MNKKGKATGVIILAIILILLLILVLLIFLFKVNIFGINKEKPRELNYKLFLIKTTNKLTTQPIESEMLIYNSSGLRYNLSNKEGVYEKVNLSIDETYITTNKTCWSTDFLFFKKEVCGEKKLDVPVAYSTYCITTTSDNYYSYSTCVNITDKSPSMLTIALSPSGDITVVSPSYLNNGDGTQTYQFKVYISNTDGYFMNGIVCLDYTFGVINAWMLKDTLSKKSYPNDDVKKCYVLEKNIFPNKNYDFDVYYKSNELYDNDFIEVSMYDRDYIYPNTELVFYNNETDLGATFTSFSIFYYS